MRGYALYDAGHLEESLTDFQAASARNPNATKPRYWYAVALARIELKQQESCAKSGERRNDQGRAIVGGVPVWCMRGPDFERSLKELTEVIRLDPKHAAAYAYRGFIYVKMRQRDNGIADLRHALQIDRNNGFARDTLRSINVAP